MPGLIEESQANSDSTRRELTIQPPPKRPWIEQPAVPFGQDLPPAEPTPINYAPTSEQQPSPPQLGAVSGVPFGESLDPPVSTFEPSNGTGELIDYAPTSEQQPIAPSLDNQKPPTPFGSQLESPITHSTQGGELDDLFSDRTGQVPGGDFDPTVVAGATPGRNVAEELLNPLKIGAAQDQARQGALVDSFIGSRDSVVDRAYATSNTGVGQSVLNLGDSLTASDARRRAGADMLTSLAYGTEPTGRGQQIPGMPSPPDSTNNPVGEIAPGAAAPTVPSNANAWWSGSVNQVTALGNLIGSLFTPADGKFDSVEDFARLFTVDSPVFRLGASIGAGLATGGRSATPNDPGLSAGQRRAFSNIGRAGQQLGQSIAPSEAINGGYQFDPLGGKFGAQGTGIAGAALYGLSAAQNVIGASIYSIADAGLVANQALIGLPVVGESIRRITNDAGSDLVNDPAVMQFGYRYQQAFGGADLSFTQDRGTEQANRSNAYLNILDPKATGVSWWARFGIGMALDLLTGGVDDVVRPGIRVARVGRIPIPVPSLRTDIARIGRPSITPLGQRIPFVETTEQVRRRAAEELRRRGLLESEELRLAQESLNLDANGNPTVIQPPNYGRNGQPGAGRIVTPQEVNGIPDPWETPEAPIPAISVNPRNQATATIEGNEAWFSNGTEATAVSIIPHPGIMPPARRPYLPAQDVVNADMAVFNERVQVEVVDETPQLSGSPERQALPPASSELPEGRVLVTPEPSPDRTLITPEPRVVDDVLTQDEFGDIPNPPDAPANTTKIREVVSPDVEVDNLSVTRAVASNPTSLEAANPVTRAAVVNEAVDNNILDDVINGVYRYTEADAREQNRLIKRLERQTDNLAQREAQARLRRQDTLPIAKERIASQAALDDAKRELGTMRRVVAEDKALLDQASPVVTSVEMRPGMTLDAYLQSTKRDITSADLAQRPRTLKELTALGKFLNGADGKPIVNLTRNRALDSSELKKLQAMYGSVFDRVGKPIPKAVLEANPLMRVETAVDSSQIVTETAFVKTPEYTQPPVTVTRQAPDPRFSDKKYAAPGSPAAINAAVKAREDARKAFLADMGEEASHELDDLGTDPGSLVDVEEFSAVAPAHLKPTEPATKKQASKMLKARARMIESGQIASELEDKIAIAQAAVVADTKQLQAVVGDGRAVAADEVLTNRVMGVEPKKPLATSYTPDDVMEAIGSLLMESFQSKKPFDLSKLREYAQGVSTGKTRLWGDDIDVPLPTVRLTPEDLAQFDETKIRAKAEEFGIDLSQPYDQIVHQVQARTTKSAPDNANFVYYDSLDQIPKAPSLKEALDYLSNTKKIRQVVNLPKAMAKKAAQLASEVNTVTWYHGTRVGMDDVSGMHPNIGSSSNLDMGAGLYLTHSPKIGALYARAAKHTESAVDQLISHGTTGSLHEVIVNLDHVVLSSDTIPKAILDQLKTVVGLGKLTKASTFSDIWSTLKESGVSAVTYQNLSSEIASILKENGVDGIQRSIDNLDSGLADDLMVLDTLDGSPLPANTTTKTEGLGSPDSLDSKIARHQVDLMMHEQYNTPYTKANELQSRLAVEGQHLQDLTDQYAKTLRQAETEVGDYVKQAEKLQEMVRKQQEIVTGIQQQQAPTIATRQAKNKLDTTRDSPCL